MIRLLALLGVFTAFGAVAQAPTEERIAPKANPVAQGQQRLGFLNRARDAAQEKVKRAELDLSEARSSEANAQKSLDAARKQRLAAGAQLDRARQELTASQKAYEQESKLFERMLKAPATAGAPDPAAKK
jgi:chromosome segregation ATPase